MCRTRWIGFSTCFVTTSVMIDREWVVAARRIEAGNPGWVVMWGPASRKFWGFASWCTSHSLITSAPDAAGLLAQMRQAEMEHGRFTYALPRAPEGYWSAR